MGLHFAVNYRLRLLLLEQNPALGAICASRLFIGAVYYSTSLPRLESHMGLARGPALPATVAAVFFLSTTMSISSAL